MVVPQALLSKTQGRYRWRLRSYVRAARLYYPKPRVDIDYDQIQYVLCILLKILVFFVSFSFSQNVLIKIHYQNTTSMLCLNGSKKIYSSVTVSNACGDKLF